MVVIAKGERGKGEEEGGSLGELGEGPGVVDFQGLGVVTSRVLWDEYRN